MKNKLNKHSSIKLLGIFLLIGYTINAQKLTTTQDSVLKSLDSYFGWKNDYPDWLTYYPKSAFLHPKIEKRFMDALYQKWNDSDMMNQIMNNSSYFKDSSYINATIVEAKEIIGKDSLRLKKVIDSLNNEYILQKKKRISETPIDANLYYKLIWFKGKAAIPILIKDLNNQKIKKKWGDNQIIKECLAKLKVEPYYSEMIKELHYDKSTWYRGAYDFINNIQFLKTQESYSMLIHILESNEREGYISSNPPCLVAVKVFREDILNDITNLFEGMPKEKERFEKIRSRYFIDEDNKIKEMSGLLVKWLKAYKGKYKLKRDNFWDDRKGKR